MEQDQTVRQIVGYLNQAIGSSFRPLAVSTKRPIVARINEGYQFSDFQAVIDEKARQWIGNETMERYLRPQTLFGSKFEAYLQEARRKVPKHQETGSGGFRNARELLE